MIDIKVSTILYFISAIMLIIIVLGLIPESKQKDCGFVALFAIVLGKLQEIIELLN